MKRILVPASLTVLTAAWAVSLGVAQDGTGGNRGTPQVVNQPVATTPSGADAPTANLLAAIGGGPTADGYLLQAAPFSVLLTLPAIFPASLSGLSNLPGTFIFSMSGGMADGGNLYHFLPNGNFVGVGASGFSAVPGLAWNLTGSTLYGTTTVAILSDGLITLNPLTGAGTLVGPMGGGVGGIDAIAFQPTSGTLFGSTGFFFDGSPGDEIVINPTTGAASKTGVMSPTPTCTVAGMAFDDAGTGYISIGCGPGSGGNIYSWNPTTNSITLLGNANGSSKSVTDIEAIF
jgi:hypothetical protein